MTNRGANFVTKLYKHIQFFANKQSALQRKLDFQTRVRADFLTNAIEQLSFPKTADGAVGQFTLVSIHNTFAF